MFYVYVCMDPRYPGPFSYNDVPYVFSHLPLYIGKGSGDRMNTHKWGTHNKILKSKIKDIKEENKSLMVRKLIDNIELEDQAYLEETKIIPKIGKIISKDGPLCNLDNGGIGGRGKAVSKETKEKIKKALKGRSFGNKFQKGHTLSIGSNNGMHGKSHTQETKDLQSLRAIERGSEHLKGIPKTNEYKDNMKKIKQTKRYRLISPEGIEFVFDRIADAGKFCDISTSVLVKLAGNRYGFDNCSGWKIFPIPL